MKAREFWVQKEPYSKGVFLAFRKPDTSGNILVREVLPNEPDLKKLAEELAYALENICDPVLKDVHEKIADEALIEYHAALEGK